MSQETLGERMIWMPFPNYQKSVASMPTSLVVRQEQLVSWTMETLLERVNVLDWKEVPLLHMWKDYEYALSLYHETLTARLRKAGVSFRGQRYLQFQLHKENSAPVPSWVGNEKIHKSHRLALLLSPMREHFKGQDFPESGDSMVSQLQAYGNGLVYPRRIV